MSETPTFESQDGEEYARIGVDDFEDGDELDSTTIQDPGAPA